MTAIAILLDEHRTIERMLGVLLAAAERLEGGREVPAGLLTDLVAFFERFADKLHHAKEEQVLFPVLGAYGLGPESTPIVALTTQHETGRGYLGELRRAAAGVEARDGASRQAFAAIAREYAELLREHIRIEDHYFEAVAAEIDPATDARLVAEMAAVDRAVQAASDPDGYRHMVERYQEVVARW